MKREIKFRAFSKETKQLYSHEDLIMTPLKDLKDDKYWSFMQFTGLLDKNGKEIYEGDIVNCRLFIGDTYTYKYSVEYVKNPFPMFSVNSRQMNDDEYEIIGNIYETPHLLN